MESPTEGLAAKGVEWGFYKLSLLERWFWVGKGGWFVGKVEGLVIIVEECVEVVRLMNLGSGFLRWSWRVWRVGPKWWGCRVSEGWWGRTVTIGIGPFGRGSR